jgi:hypothetical protein
MPELGASSVSAIACGGTRSSARLLAAGLGGKTPQAEQTRTQAGRAVVYVAHRAPHRCSWADGVAPQSALHEVRRSAPAVLLR